jgi:signal transduction histidine kinase
MLQKEPQLEEVLLKDLVADAQKRLGTQPSAESSDVRVELDPDYPVVIGDASDLTTMFYYLLQNSLEAADSQEDIAEITSRPRNTDSPFLQIEIFNEGRLPNDEEIPTLFVPFYSSKPLGTGLGLPIARLAARKSHGDLVLEPKPTGGVRCTIRLPLPQREGSGAYRVPSNPPPPLF